MQTLGDLFVWLAFYTSALIGRVVVYVLRKLAQDVVGEVAQLIVRCFQLSSRCREERAQEWRPGETDTDTCGLLPRLRHRRGQNC